MLSGWEYGWEARWGHPWAWDGAFRRLRGGSTRFIDGVGGGRKVPWAPVHPHPPLSCLRRPFELAPALCSGYEGAQTGHLKLPTVGLGFGLFLSFGFQGEQVERNVPAPGTGGTSRPACVLWSMQCPRPRVVIQARPSCCLLALPTRLLETLFPRPTFPLQRL